MMNHANFSALAVEQDDRPAHHIAIIGLMGAGKSTLADALSESLGWPHRDSDADVEAIEGICGAELAERDGVARLHEIEEQALLEALESAEPVVVSAAGWVVESAICRRRLVERAFVVWIDLDVASLLERMKGGPHRRPMGESEVRELAARREPLFREVADIRLDGRKLTWELLQELTDVLMRSPLTVAGVRDEKPGPKTGAVETLVTDVRAGAREPTEPIDRR